MTDTPPQSNGTRCQERRPLSQHGRDRRKMIGIEGMAQAKKKTDPEQGQ